MSFSAFCALLWPILLSHVAQSRADPLIGRVSVLKKSPEDLPPLPDYDNPPVPFWEQHGPWVIPVAVFLLTVLLTVVAFPPFQTPEAAYVFAMPALLWAYRRPNFRLYALVTLGAQTVAWWILVWWLHNATWLGYILLGPLMGVWVGSWFLFAGWFVPRLFGLPTMTRLFGVLALGGAWVLIEWSRTWLLSGFPWLPLAASQWERASILQVSAYTGAAGVSFVLVLMNVGFAAYAHRLFFEPELRGLRKRSQEFLLAVFALMVAVSIHIQESVNRYHFNVPLGRVGFVQPNVPQEVKWNPEHGPSILRTLEQTTLTAASRHPDFILWPEAVTPWAAIGDPTVRDWVSNLTAQAGVPVILGSIAIEPPVAAGDKERWYNAALLADPELGVSPSYYAKRHLLPFGEYVPLRWLLGWIDKIVPVGGDFQVGDSAIPLFVPMQGEITALGPLICYEDTFANLARANAQAGADLQIVLTNNGWFGESGGAEQHAAHSVLRAVETRRPVLRCGNAGWSGWIDEFGTVRAVLRAVKQTDADGRVREVVSTQPDRDVEGTIYFRGSGIIDVTRDSRWIDRSSFYVLNGDWFVIASAVMLAFGFMVVGAAQPKSKR